MAVSKVILNGTTLIDTTDKTVTSESMLSGITALKNDGTTATGSIASKTSSDLTASGATVTAPAGFYSAPASKSVATTTHPNPTASINSTTGVVTASHTQTAGYVAAGTTTGTLQLSAQAAKTVTPTESEQTAVSAGKYTTGDVKVGAISTTYVGSGIDQNDSTDLTVSGATVTAPAGYYASAASKSVASGTAGTPTATKGTVSNHSVSITPSVTNTTGYIAGGTKNGTAVSVSAAELVSGTKTISENGTGIDVANYAAVDVSVSGGGGALGDVTVPSTVNKQTIYPDGRRIVLRLANSIDSNSATSVAITISTSDISNMEFYIPYEVSGALTVSTSDNTKTSNIQISGTTYRCAASGATVVEKHGFPFTATGDNLVKSIYASTGSADSFVVGFNTAGRYNINWTSDLAFKEMGFREVITAHQYNGSYSAAVSWDSSSLANGDICAVSGCVQGVDRSGVEVYVATFDEHFTWDGNSHSFNIMSGNTAVASCSITATTITYTSISSIRNLYGGIGISKHSEYDGLSSVTIEPGTV